MQTFILIHTTVGSAEAVARQVVEIRGVEAADAVTGPYDVLVRTVTDSLDEVTHGVLPRIQTVPGVTRTILCPALGHRYSWVDRLEASVAGV